jgi:hypothetical protein
MRRPGYMRCFVPHCNVAVPEAQTAPSAGPTGRFSRSLPRRAVILGGRGCAAGAEFVKELSGMLRR